MSTPKKQRTDVRESPPPAAATSSSPAAALSAELVLRVLSYSDGRDVAAASGTCAAWRGAVCGEASAPLWRGLVELHHVALIETVPSPSASFRGWRDLFLRAKALAARVRPAVRAGITAKAERIRECDELFEAFGSEYSLSGRVPYQSPTSGTTATAVPDESGAFSTPVYYDWGANWDRVSELLLTPRVQKVLEQCVREASDGYYFGEWDETKIWPFLFNHHRRYGNGEQEALMKKFLNREQVRELNGLVADWFKASGESLLLLEEYNSDRLAEELVAKELKSGGRLNEEGHCTSIVNAIADHVYSMMDEDESGHEFLESFRNASEAALYHKDSPIRATLLCTLTNCFAFLPLNHILAKLLSPEDAELKEYENHTFCGYSVVVDEKRNIVFDNNWYFLGIPASSALKTSKE